MSHAKERIENNCLNCGALVTGRYCSNCGQENLVPQETVWHLIAHFFNDITHFDGKFFSSLKLLIIRPGFLSKEYVAGKRASYLNPIRMYVFTSFIFFFIFFTFITDSGDNGVLNRNASPKQSTKDSLQSVQRRSVISDSVKPEKVRVNEDGIDVGNALSTDEVNYRDVKEYDSLVDAGKVKDGFFSRWMERRQLAIDKKYGYDKKRINEAIEENFKHSFPQVFFISLPLLALMLKLIYFRRKQFYYVSHAIFTVHIFIFTFIALLFMYLIDLIAGLPNMNWFGWLNGLLGVGIFFYVYKAMRIFYEQRRGKTIFKYLIFLLSFFVITIIAMILVALVAVAKL